jgi:glycosyltransferase involved in cell wall biosynthesis
MPEISTIVITYNEERNIQRCLESVVPFSDEIVVVDSGSTDRTVEISRRYATRVISHEWLGYGRQKRLAMEHSTCPWVFSIDADEEVSSALGAEILSLDFEVDGYEMPRKAWYLNRWIEHSGWYPGYILRLFNRERGSFTDEIVHEYVDVSGKVGRLKNDLYHYSYRNVAHHVEKMNDLTTLAARQMDEQDRRAGIHNIAFYPFFEFLKVYFWKKGFLDGLAGITISALHAYYVFLKYAKLYEIKSSRLAAENGGRDGAER